MEITFTPTKSDYAAFWLYHTLHSDEYRKAVKSYRWGALAWLAWGPVLVLALRDSPVSTIVAVSAIAVAFSATLFFFGENHLKQKYQSHFRKHLETGLDDRFYTEPCTVSLTADGVSWTGFWGQTTFNYSVLGDTAEDGSYTYIFFNKEPSFFLPSSRIPKDQLDAFLGELRKRKAAAVLAGNA